MKPLILYFEAVAIQSPLNGQIKENLSQKCITKDYYRLKDMNNKMAELITKVEKIKEDGLIEEVDKMTIEQESFEKALKDSLYLKEITEDLIFEVYQPAIEAVHNREFENFN